MITNTQLRNYWIIAQLTFLPSQEKSGAYFSHVCVKHTGKKNSSTRALFTSELGMSDLEQNPLNLHLLCIQNYIAVV